MMNEDPQSEPLLTPLNSALVLICPQAKFSSAVQSTDAVDIVDAFVALSRSATALAIPCLIFLEATAENYDVVDKSLQRVVELDVLHFSLAPHPWLDTQFIDKVNAMGRRRLVVGGFTTEGAVSFASLNALADGFHVHVVSDACGGAELREHETALARLQQAGAVLVTARGVALEWSLGGEGAQAT